MGNRQIKNYMVLKELMIAPFHPRLVALAMWCFHRWSDFIVTSGYREHDTGVHGTWPCRGLDVSSWPFKDPEAMAADANAHFFYDPKRPEKMCVIYHDAGSGYHFHLQAHDRTLYLCDSPG